MLFYLHGDHLGSTSVATAISAVTMTDLRYCAYGSVRSGNPAALPTGLPQQFQMWTRRG